ncbi:TlyA family RNA methyltransferase [Sneathiella limimaris]|uniref:TlyA family RNA methyltransferase n=1 Tax=Sneathiella limimaris TaxID=1964213 RepID=UPI00146F0F0C|nr:TlyA family RNA methyltransferase [Sneathiella limimaris]
MPSNRLDQELVARGLVASRARAQHLIQGQQVFVNGEIAVKSSQKVQDNSEIRIDSNYKDWVSRGALKLLAGLEAFNITPKGLVAADIGASTGGFCEVLLEQGIAKIYAVDVGHDQLHERLKGEPRLINLEGVNARNLTSAEIPEPIDLVVSDVSFISLKKALPAALSFCRKGAYLVALIKPQFEVGAANIAKGGIVKDDAVRDAVRLDMENWIETMPGWKLLGTIDSPITGSDGNHEFLLGARYEG